MTDQTSPAPSAPDLDAIRARAEVSKNAWYRRDVPALLDALDAAEAEKERLRGQRAGALAELDRLHRIKEAIFSSNGRMVRETDALRTEKIAAKRRAMTAEAERDEARAALAALLTDAERNIRDAKAGETYAAEVNQGVLLASEQARRAAWESVERKARAALAAAPSETEEGRA